MCLHSPRCGAGRESKMTGELYPGLMRFKTEICYPLPMFSTK